MEQYLLYILMLLIPFSCASCASTEDSEKPLVKVTHKVLSNITDQLNCRAYGHSPKKISMTWYQNEEPVHNNWSETETFPLPDSTYLSRLILNITTHHDEVYSCHVSHSSLKSPLVVEWGLPEESSSEPIGAIITICLAGIVIFVVTIVVSVLITKFRKK
ncbi:hereditary hemochromatosis protein homolog [Lithobates pipiens]